jgi:hypothetical protein
VTRTPKPRGASFVAGCGAEVEVPRDHALGQAQLSRPSRGADERLEASLHWRLALQEPAAFPPMAWNVPLIRLAVKVPVTAVS